MFPTTMEIGIFTNDGSAKSGSVGSADDNFLGSRDLDSDAAASSATGTSPDDYNEETTRVKAKRVGNGGN